MGRRTAVCICNSLVHSPLSSLHNMTHQKAVVILCCVFLLSAAVPIREEASGAASIAQHECEKDGEVYETGAQLNDTEEPCQLCYCQKGKLVCALIQCYHRDDCEPHFVPGRCCPKYDHCPALGEKKDETLLPMTMMVEDDIGEFALGDDPSAYFAGDSANSSSENHNSAEAGVTSESVAQSEEEQILDLSKILTGIHVESSTAKFEHDGKSVGEPNLFESQQKEKVFGNKDDNDSGSTEDVIAERNGKFDYQNEEGEDENTLQNAGELHLSEMQQKKNKHLDSKDDNDSVSTEEMVVRSIVNLDYQDEHEEENNQHKVEETQSSEYNESLQSKQENDGSSEAASELKVLEHQHEAQQDAQQNIGEHDSEMHPYKEQLINTDNNHDVQTVIEPDYQDDENEQQSSQQNVGEPDASQYEEKKQNEQGYYDGTTDIITTERNQQDDESIQENDQQHIGKQDSSDLNVNGESLQDENYNDGTTEAVFTEMNLNHQDEEEYKQENEQPVGEQASFETNFDGNNDDTTEVIATESYINPDHQDEHKPENNQQNVEELQITLVEESLQVNEQYDGATEAMPVKKNVKLDYQDKYDDDQPNIGEPHSSEKLYNAEEMHYEGITEAAITERSMNLDSHTEENQLEKKQQDEAELHLSEIQEGKKQEDTEENMGNALETTKATSTEKNPVVGTVTLIVGSHDVTELPYIAKHTETNGERMESDYTIYRSKVIEGPRSADYVNINNGNFNDMKHEVHKEAATEDTDTLTLNKNSTDENTSKEKEPDWSNLPFSEEGSGSNRLDDCAGGNEECAFLVKEWRILIPQLAMAPTPSPVDFWEYYDYSSSEVRPISYNDPEEVLVLLPHPPQNDQNVAESLDNTAEFATQHKAQNTNHIL